MKRFEDLVFKSKGYADGEYAVLEFPNGYGISVITGYGSYSNAASPYEIAVLCDGKITYDTDITNDVIGYLTHSEVTEYMEKIQQLPPIE
jgi:hypothetical protein